MYASTYKSGKCDKMLQVTNLLMVYMYVYTFAILMDQTAPTAAVDKEIIDLAAMNQDLGMNQTDSDQLCLNSYYIFNQLHCDQSEPLLINGYCVTYNEDTNIMSGFSCPYFQPNGYNITHYGLILLPRNLSQLNDYMCGPLNRTGLVCSECADGFGPSVTSFGYKCVNCTDAWHGVPLFLFLEFVPITVFYLIVLVFQISVTSAPMPCFIISSQFIITTFDLFIMQDRQRPQVITDHRDLRLDMKIVFSFYQIFNLNFYQNLLAPYCVSNKLKFIHIAFLGYISAFYPILLICLTWICVELHGRNFRPLVWLWRPFHRCFVRLRRGWDTKSDIIDAFTTFFFLTYSKILSQTLLLISSKPIKNVEPSGKSFLTYVSEVDQSVAYGGMYHLSFAIPGIFISIIFNILPLLLLILYPIRAFRSCLSKCHLNSIILHTFLDKVYACYRNSLDGGRDMRNFSGLYFLLGIIAYFTAILSHTMSSYLFISRWFAMGTVFFVITLAMTIAKPYRKAYMNHLDALLLSYCAIFCYVLPFSYHTQLFVRILITTPIAVFIIIIILKKLYGSVKSYKCKLNSQRCVHKYFCCYTSKRIPVTVESTQNSTANTPTSTQPLIQPTSTVMSYGIKDS